MKNRNTKIGCASRPHRKSTNGTGLKFYPQLILQGAWMKEAGFEIGKHTEIQVSEKEIKISIAQTEEEKVSQYKTAYEDFTAYLDSLFYSGYAVRLAENQPQHFNNEFNTYLKNHNYENI